MTLLVVQGGDRALTASGRTLQVEVRGDVVHRVAPDRLSAILIEGPVRMTAAARRLVLRAKLEVTFLDGRGRWLGRQVGLEPRGGTTRLAQARAALDPSRRLALARACVSGKLHNHYRVLRRSTAGRPTEHTARALAMLRATRERLDHVADIAELMGMEGHGARTWFSCIPHLLRNAGFTWTGRNRRPPRDPLNATLSYVYTLLCAETDAAVRRAGLDPAFGMLHETGRGKPACALDLAEEWRPVADAFVLGLVNRRQLSPDDFEDPTARYVDPATTEPLPWDPVEPGEEQSPTGDAAPDPDAEGSAGDEDSLEFEPPEEGPSPNPVTDPAGEADPRPPVYLAASGRRVVLAAWSQRLDQRLFDPHLEARFELGELIRLQARRFATACRQDQSYTPFLWR